MHDPSGILSTTVRGYIEDYPRFHRQLSKKIFDEDIGDLTDATATISIWRMSKTDSKVEIPEWFGLKGSVQQIHPYGYFGNSNRIDFVVVFDYDRIIPYGEDVSSVPGSRLLFSPSAKVVSDPLLTRKCAEQKASVQINSLIEDALETRKIHWVGKDGIFHEGVVVECDIQYDNGNLYAAINIDNDGLHSMHCVPVSLIEIDN